MAADALAQGDIVRGQPTYISDDLLAQNDKVETTARKCVQELLRRDQKQQFLIAGNTPAVLSVYTV